MAVDPVIELARRRKLEVSQTRASTYDDANLHACIGTLTAKLDQLIASHNALMAEFVRLEHNLAHHDHETIREVAAA